MAARPIPAPLLSDGSVTLRQSEPADLPTIAAGIRDPDVIRWVGPPEGDAVDILALNRERWMSGSPTLSICERDGLCVGLVWVNVSEGDGATGSVGYWLLPSGRGRGLATRAVLLISGWAVNELGLTNVRLTAHRDNNRSRRVADRSGFSQTGVLHRTTVDGMPLDEVIYELPRPAT